MADIFEKFDKEFIHKYKYDSLFNAIGHAIQAGEDPYRIIQHCVVAHSDLISSLKEVVQKVGVPVTIIVEKFSDVKLPVKGLIPDKIETLAILFELVRDSGEGIQDNFHFVNSSEYETRLDWEESWRVYYKNKYCVDIFRSRAVADEEIGGESSIDGYIYDYKPVGEIGFEHIPAAVMVKLIKTELYEY